MTDTEPGSINLGTATPSAHRVCLSSLWEEARGSKKPARQLALYWMILSPSSGPILTGNHLAWESWPYTEHLHRTHTLPAHAWDWVLNWSRCGGPWSMVLTTPQTQVFNLKHLPKKPAPIACLAANLKLHITQKNHPELTVVGSLFVSLGGPKSHSVLNVYSLSGQRLGQSRPK